MAQQDIKQIRGASQGSILFLGTNSVVSEDFNNLNWNQSNNILYINGNIQIIDGNQQSGYVLTSDANGLASWSPGSTQSISEITISGTQNGVNKDFTLSSELTYPQNLFFINGQLVTEGIDYTISGPTLSVSIAPESSDILRLFATIAPLDGSGIISLNSLIGINQFLTSTSSNSNIDLIINSSINTHTFDVNINFNNSGTGSNDVWSADQIIEYVGNTENPSTLSDVMTLGNTASTSLDMNQFDIAQISYMQFSGFNVTGLTISSDILTIDKTIGDSIKLEYRVVNSLGYKRTGTLMIVWDSNDSQFTDYSSEDLNGATDAIEFETSILGSDLLVTATIEEDTWDIKYTYSIM
jgi:hypothetical protein